MKRSPMAFMSYAHIDNDDDRLTEFRKRLSKEVGKYTGDEFPIFQDTDIEWGQNWKERIENSLDEVTFFIPIITPSFIKSNNCQKELLIFRDREKKLKRNDLILPVYYIEVMQQDEIDRIAGYPQYVDWKTLRFESFGSTKVRKAMANLAVQVRNALIWRGKDCQ